MNTPRISASSYSNTAPLIWSFLYGSRHGHVELILDNAPARSAQLLGEGRVDAALVPVIAYHEIEDVRLVPGVCVGAREKVRSVCLVTRGQDLADVRSVALDVSSRTSTVLTKIIFREFLGFDPEWRQAEPDVEAMLQTSDCALVIGDPALSISDFGFRISDCVGSTHHVPDAKSQIPDPKSEMQTHDLAELWHHHTGFGFIFAMWMTRTGTSPVDFAAARDEGVLHLDEIVSNYFADIGMSRDELLKYLSENISYVVDDSLQAGMDLYFKLAGRCGLIETARPIEYLE
jgi:chorismate dehydratase